MPSLVDVHLLALFHYNYVYNKLLHILLITMNKNDI